MRGPALATGTATEGIGWAGTDLESLGDGQRGTLAGLASNLEFEPGAVILREGEATAFMGLLVGGRVALRLQVPARGPQTVVTLEPGDVFGWSALVPPYRATSDAVALTAARVQAFDATRLRAWIASDPKLAVQLLPIVLRCLSERLTTSWQQLLDLFATPGLDAW